ncbi:MAG: hypothetical protein ACKVWR_08480 [Acidimicrobiales bacterium]
MIGVTLILSACPTRKDFWPCAVAAIADKSEMSGLRLHHRRPVSGQIGQRNPLMELAGRPSSLDAVQATDDEESTVDLYWIPLGAGSPAVQASGRLFESVSARIKRRPRCDLYHAALNVFLPQGRFAIEQAPVPDNNGAVRGVVATGPVGIRAAGRLRLFRYEVRCWCNGIIPDIGDAVDSPVRVSTNGEVAARIVALLPEVPTLVWGRDEADAGDMWNSNSVISWALTRSGVDVDSLRAPVGGRAPGWTAGRAVAVAPDHGVGAAVRPKHAQSLRRIP